MYFEDRSYHSTCKHFQDVLSSFDEHDALVGSLTKYTKTSNTTAMKQ